MPILHSDALTSSPDRGTGLVPPVLMARFDVLKHPSEKPGSGKMELPTGLEDRLNGIIPLVSATDSAVRIDAQVQIDEAVDAFEVEMSRDDLHLHFKKPARFRQEPTEQQLEQLKSDWERGIDSWRKIIANSLQGDDEALRKLLGGIWGVQRFDLEGDTSVDVNWKDEFFKDDPFGRWFIGRIAGRSLAHHNAMDARVEGWSADSIVTNGMFSQLADFGHRRRDPISSQNARLILSKVVDNILAFGRTEKPEEGLLIYDLQTRLLSEIQQMMEREVASSTPAQILAQTPAIMASAALEDRDIGRLMAEAAKAAKFPDVVYDEATSTLTLSTREGMSYALQELRQLIDSSGKFVHANLGMTLAAEIKPQTKEDQLVSFREVQDKVKRGITIPPLVMAEIGLQADIGFIYQILTGPGGTGKTTTAVTIHDLLEHKLVESGRAQELPLLRPKENTPESILAAMKQAAWRLIQGKPTYLLLDEAHDALDGKITETQSLEFLTLQSIINRYAEAGQLPIGGMVICSEKPMRDIRIKELGTGGQVKSLDDVFATLKAAGRAHRFPEQEIVLWTGNKEEDLQVLSDLVQHETDLSRLGEAINPLVDAIGQRLTAIPLDERKYLSPSFIFHTIKLHHRLLVDGTPIEKVLPILDREITKQLGHGVTIELAGVRQRLEAEIAAQQKQLDETRQIQQRETARGDELEARNVVLNERVVELEANQILVMQRLEALERRGTGGASLLETRGAVTSGPGASQSPTKPGDYFRTSGRK